MTKQTYKGQEVTVVRPAKQGDPGYDPDKKQTLIKLKDGSEQIVATGEVHEAEPDQSMPGQGKPSSATSQTAPDGQPMPTPVAGSPPVDHP